MPCQGESTPSAKGPAKPPKMHYKGPMDVASKVWATEGGLRGIYKGLVPTLAREVPGNALMFGAYEALKRKARDLQVCYTTLESSEEKTSPCPPSSGLKSL